MTENEGNVVTEQPVAETEAPAPTELQAAPSAEPVAEQPPAEQATESAAEQSAAPTSNDAPTP
jgi:hypothetical protein